MIIMNHVIKTKNTKMRVIQNIKDKTKNVKMRVIQNINDFFFFNIR